MNGSRALLWWMGWNPKFAFILSPIVAVAASIWLGPVPGILCGLPILILWALGVRLIQTEAGTELLKAENRMWMAGLQELGIDPTRLETFILHSARGEKVPLVTRSPEHWFTVLFVGDTFFAAYEDCVFNLASGSEIRGDTVRMIYFRNIVDVDFRESGFEVRTNTGESLRWPSSSAVAGEALSAIRQRLPAPGPVTSQNLEARLAAASPLEPPTVSVASPRSGVFTGEYCWRCGSPKYRDQRFCSRCGGRYCPACGHATPPDSLFCETCGHLLQSEAETGSLTPA